jgi:ubiquitin carboxyl-terminal hydrolase 14
VPASERWPATKKRPRSSPFAAAAALHKEDAQVSFGDRDWYALCLCNCLSLSCVACKRFRKRIEWTSLRCGGGMVIVQIKWNKQVFPTEVSEDETARSLMERLQKLTGVPSERLTLLGLKRGAVRVHTAGTLAALGLQDGCTVMLLGTPVSAGAAAVSQAVANSPLSPERAGAGVTGPTAPSASATPPLKHVRRGLANLGNSCYANATIQCLLQVPELRDYLRSRVQSSASLAPAVTTADAEHRVVMALAALAETLSSPNAVQGSSDNPERFYPQVVMAALRSAYPQFAQRDNHGMYMQQDAEECLSQILGALARMEPPTTGTNWVDATFGTLIASTDRCDEPNEVSTACTPVVSHECLRLLPCHISKQVNHLSEGIREGLEGSIERYVDSLGRTLNWKRESRIERLPPYLIVHFVRFFWKPVEKVKAKVLRKVVFPLILDTLPFCTDSLQDALRAARTPTATTEADAEGALQDAQVGGSSSSSSSSSGKPDTPSGLYELFAVLTHQGRTADSGHYVAWVRDPEQPLDRSVWLKYDDDRVETVTEDQILRLCGGGDWHMAYICFYRMRPGPGTDEKR